MSWDDDQGSWDEDPEGPSAEDRRRFSADTVSCPDCGSEVHDESVSCPECGHWIEDGGDGDSGPPRSQVALGVVLAVAIAGGGLIWWLIRSFG